MTAPPAPQTRLEKLTKQAKRNKPAEDLLFQIKTWRGKSKQPLIQAEYRFHHTRLWRFDVALVKSVYCEPFGFRDIRLAVEVDGGGFLPGGGRHSRGQGIEQDCEKYAEAMKLGWRVLRVTPKMVKNGTALNYITELLK